MSITLSASGEKSSENQLKISSVVRVHALGDITSKFWKVLRNLINFETGPKRSNSRSAPLHGCLWLIQNATFYLKNFDLLFFQTLFLIEMYTIAFSGLLVSWSEDFFEFHLSTMKKRASKSKLNYSLLRILSLRQNEPLLTTEGQILANWLSNQLL